MVRDGVKTEEQGPKRRKIQERKEKLSPVRFSFSASSVFLLYFLLCHCLYFHFCHISTFTSLFPFSPPLSLSSLSLSLTRWLQTVLNVGHPVWKLSPLSFSHPLPHHSFIPSFSASFSPLLWFVWALCRLLDSSPGWILLHWIWFRMQTESAESLGPAASVSWNQSVWYPWLW